MPSWEEVVSWVVVGSSGNHLRESAAKWQAVFNDLETIQDSVTKLKQDIGHASWAGQGADALVEHLAKISNMLHTLIMDNRRIVVGLQDAAAHLDGTVGKIPIPAWVKDEATHRRTTFDSSGQLTEYQTNEFYNRMPWTTIEGSGEAEVGFNLGQRFWYWYQDYMQTADSERVSLLDNYAADARRIGTGNRVAPPQVGGASRTGSGIGGGAGSKQLPTDALSTGVSTPMMPTATPPPGLDTSALNSNLDPNDVQMPDTSALDSSGTDGDLGQLGGVPDLDTSSLGGGGATGFGPLPTGGLGPLPKGGLGPLPKGGGTGLAGVGSLGAGAGGLGSGGLGPLVSPEAMVGQPPGSTAAAGLAGAGDGAGLAGAGAGAMGMMPGGVGGGGVPSDAAGETGTRLVEDDKNIFGSRPGDRDLPGDVIG
ncbi:hypothetical protein GCM10023322_27930 [Rugosimonospora acidiphila]|uniref:Uncharacterized protein n=1 Tax=Rugosimonospora acidiphila TaxID=556531 RepID=A0ABP9RSU7_9ACTN